MQKSKKMIAVAAFALILSITAARAAAYESLTYLYGGTTAVYLKRMEKTGSNIGTVSPDYYETAFSGAIIHTKTPDTLLIAAMHERGIRVTPFVSNHWNRNKARAMLADRASAAAYLAADVEKYGLDGLDIDIQNITPEDKTNFTDFIRLLRGALPKNKILTVCVAANPYNTPLGWQGAYDYAALSDYCDHIFMMTYDESYDNGPPGPVASLSFIEDSIKYGLKHVPPGKLMMGIPFYGRYWAKSTTGGKGAAWTIADIEWLIEATNAEVWYDGQRECARAAIVVPPGSNYKTWGGSEIKPDTYDVWYENARSFERKLALVRKYNIRGVGSWALGQEPSYVWDNYAAWLNGYPFNDIAEHWAQSYIITLAHDGLLAGRENKLFMPEGTLTRAEAAALLCRTAGIEPYSANAFPDTAGHWASGYIAAAHDNGLVTGVDAARFQPDRAVTREEFAVLCERYVNIDDTLNMTDSPYSDVSKETNPWSNDAIIKLSVNNVLSGYSDGAFRPRGLITRGETAKAVTLLRELPSKFISGKKIAETEEFMSPR